MERVLETLHREDSHEPETALRLGWSSFGLKRGTSVGHAGGLGFHCPASRPGARGRFLIGLMIDDNASTVSATQQMESTMIAASNDQISDGVVVVVAGVFGATVILTERTRFCWDIDR